METGGVAVEAAPPFIGQLLRFHSVKFGPDAGKVHQVLALLVDEDVHLLLVPFGDELAHPAEDQQGVLLEEHGSVDGARVAAGLLGQTFQEDALRAHGDAVDANTPGAVPARDSWIL